MSEPAPHGRAGLARFVVGTGVANGLGLLWSALVGRWLGAAGSADYFAALFVLQAVYMAGHPLNGVLARFGAVYRSEGQPRRTLALVRWLFVRAALACVAVGMVVALTFEAQVAGLHFDDRWALTLGWIGGGVALTLGLLRGALRGVGLLDALAVNFNAEALLRLLIGATLIGALAAWWASPLASPSLASLPSSGSPSSSPSLLRRPWRPQRRQRSPPRPSRGRWRRARTAGWCLPRDQGSSRGGRGRGGRSRRYLLV